MKPEDAGDGPRTFEGGRVTLVIRVYNSERYLVPCIESALNQTYGNIEIMAVNDGSTDGSAEILGRYSDRIRIVNTEHRGRAAAYNAAIARMTGEWLATLDSDDIMYPDAVEQLVGAGERLGSSSATKVIPIFICQRIRSDGRPDGRIRSCNLDNSMGPIEQGALLSFMHFYTLPVSIIHRSILEEQGGFDEGLGYYEDIDFALRLCLVHRYRFHHIQRIIYGYRVHGAGLRTSTEERMKIKRRKADLADRLGESDRKTYEDVRRRSRLTRVCVCGRANTVLNRFICGVHEGKAARLAAGTLAALLGNPLVQHLIRVLVYNANTTKIRPRQD